LIDNGKGVFTKVVAGRLQVKCPYNGEFVLFAHRMDGRWRNRTEMWSFRTYQFREVATKLNELFGTKLKVTKDPRNA
jgi:hypothetical protein